MVSMDFIYRTEFEVVKVSLVLAAVMQFFIDFHQGPPRTIWQGHRPRLSEGTVKHVS